VIALSTLSLFSWPVARLLWLGINLAMMLIIPGLVIRLFPVDFHSNTYAKGLIYLAFLGMFGTRNIAGNGQTSLLIFALMLLAVISLRRSWLSAGIWLGLALSKYSLSFPVMIYFIIKKQYLAAFTALIVQLAAAALLAAWVGVSPLTIFGEYAGILRVHTGLPGIHLANLFLQEPVAGAAAGTAAAILMTVVVAAVMFHWLRKDNALGDSNASLEQLANVHILPALTMWTLLVAYHRAYDSFVAILFLHW
jgi:hypothetical protein